jgi:hypothetical protein
VRKFAQKATLLILLFYTCSLSLLFSQTSFDEEFQNFADAMNTSLPFATSMGLGWSAPYLGPLLGHPVHFGVGVSVTGVFMSNAHVSALGEQMGITIDDSFIKDKQWLPSYVFAFRFGGVILPFDFGFKIGYLPDMALWGSLDYNALIFGFDFNYAVYISDDGGPIITIGAGIDKLEGGAKGTLDAVPVGVSSKVSTGTSARIAWKSSTYKAKGLLALPILGSTWSVFMGIDLGYSSNEIGVNFGDDKNNPDYENMRELTTISVSGNMGVGAELGVWRIDASIMASFTTFEIGFNLGFRYQL